MLRTVDLARFSAHYGVTDAQITRDHLISHILAALPGLSIPDLHFFGGTALSRTLLEGERLSEDIDLLHAAYASTLEEIASRLPGALRREFPGVRFSPGGNEGQGKFVFLDAADVPAIKVYVGALHVERPSWEFTTARVALRYPDLDPYVELSCPTPATFAAMKMEAYVDRHAPRDLFDLAGLARRRALGSEAEDQLRNATGVGFVPEEFGRVPTKTAAAWETELAHQVRTMTTAEACRATVASALNKPRADDPETPS